MFLLPHIQLNDHITVNNFSATPNSDQDPRRRRRHSASSSPAGRLTSEGHPKAVYWKNKPRPRCSTVDPATHNNHTTEPFGGNPQGTSIIRRLAARIPTAQRYTLQPNATLEHRLDWKNFGAKENTSKCPWPCLAVLRSCAKGLTVLSGFTGKAVNPF